MHNHLPLTFIAVLTFLTGTVGDFLVPTSTGNEAPIVADGPATFEFVDMPADFEIAATWATDLFDEAGLDLPSLRYVFHGDTPEPCRNRPGYRHMVDGINVIEICSAEMSNATQGMILHETAHAFIDHTLTDERKAAFQELRGWTFWRNYEEAGWHENGTEQAAEIMVWGLIDRPLNMIRITQNSCDELDAGYRTLTGEAPLHGYRDAC